MGPGVIHYPLPFSCFINFCDFFNLCYFDFKIAFDGTDLLIFKYPNYSFEHEHDTYIKYFKSMYCIQHIQLYRFSGLSQEHDASHFGKGGHGL